MDSVDLKSGARNASIQQKVPEFETTDSGSIQGRKVMCCNGTINITGISSRETFRVFSAPEIIGVKISSGLSESTPLDATSASRCYTVTFCGASAQTVDSICAKSRRMLDVLESNNDVVLELSGSEIDHQPHNRNVCPKDRYSASASNELCTGEDSSSTDGEESVNVPLYVGITTKRPISTGSNVTDTFRMSSGFRDRDSFFSVSSASDSLAGSDTLPSLSGPAPRIRFPDEKKIRNIVEKIEREEHKGNASGKILNEVMTYRLEKVTIGNFHGQAKAAIRSRMIKICAVSAGWASTDYKTTAQQYPVTMGDSHGGNDKLHPELLIEILNNDEMFEYIAELKQYRSSISRNIHHRFSRQIIDSDHRMLYQLLTGKQAVGDGVSKKDAKRFYKENSAKLVNDCDLACMQFILEFCSLVRGANNLSDAAYKLILSRGFKVRVDCSVPGFRVLKTRFSPDLLLMCVSLRMAIDIVERKLIDSKSLVKFQKRFIDGVEVCEAIDYAGIDDNNRKMMKDILTIMADLEKEANVFVNDWLEEINKFRRADSAGKSFEERVLELERTSDDRYIIKPFESLKGIFNRILSATEPSLYGERA